MLIVDGGGGVPWFKGGGYGPAGSGKTTTGVIIGNGIIDYFKLPGDFYFFDTETGSEYVNPLSKLGGRYGIKGTGKNLKICKSRTYSDLMQFFREAEKNRAAFVLVDSMTHVREEIMSSMLAQINKGLAAKGRNPLMKLEFHHTSAISEMMNKLCAFYLNAELHILVNGRSQNMWKMEKNEETDKRELISVGTKMKAGNDMAYEPSLLFEMDTERDKSGNAGARRICTIWKDRFGLLDGQQVENPTFDFFKPYIECLTPGSINKVDATSQTNMTVTEDGNAEWNSEKRHRTIASENYLAALMLEWPGASASEKLARQKCCQILLGTMSQTEIEESIHSDKLKAAIQAMPEAVKIVKAEMAAKEAEEAAKEAADKEAKKAKK